MAAALRTLLLTIPDLADTRSTRSTVRPSRRLSADCPSKARGRAMVTVLSSVHVGLASRAASYVRVCRVRSTYCSSIACMCFVRDLRNRFRL